ncbi:ribonuclease H-like domain-containing protein [Tanacetum coccineum]
MTQVAFATTAIPPPRSEGRARERQVHLTDNDPKGDTRNRRCKLPKTTTYAHSRRATHGERILRQIGSPGEDHQEGKINQRARQERRNLKTRLNTIYMVQSFSEKTKQKEAKNFRMKWLLFSHFNSGQHSVGATTIEIKPRVTTATAMAYSDADWAGCPTTRRSTSGYCVFLDNNLLSWSSKRQFTLSRSSVEAEYRGVANAVAETCWLRNLLRELHTPLATATLIYCDNVSAVYLSSNPVQHQRTKHIEIDIYFVRDLVATDAIRVLHVSSPYQYADIFTKGLPTSLFDEFCTSLSICSSPAPTAGGC